MNKYVITIKENWIYGFLYKDSRVEQIQIFPYESGDNCLKEAIFLGRVQKVMPQMKGAFVEYLEGQIGFLEYKPSEIPSLTGGKDHLHAGDQILVQYERDGVKTKVPALSSNLSFTGKYAVVTTVNTAFGVSKKIPSEKAKELKAALENSTVKSDIFSSGFGVVLRTNCMYLQDFAPIEEEIKTLIKQAKQVMEYGNYRTCFSVLYRPLGEWLQAIRDFHESDTLSIETDQLELYSKLQNTFPEREIILYQDTRISMEKVYSLETRLLEALDTKVLLKSGGYLVIEPTEALTVIDVNSGKNLSKKDRDIVILELNKEAALEIAHQCRVRNISGMIVVDFINQKTKQMDEELCQYFASCLKTDPVPTKFVDMTALGLVEFTRKKTGRSLAEQIKETKYNTRKE